MVDNAEIITMKIPSRNKIKYKIINFSACKQSVSHFMCIEVYKRYFIGRHGKLHVLFFALDLDRVIINYFEAP